MSQAIIKTVQQTVARLSAMTDVHRRHTHLGYTTRDSVYNQFQLRAPNANVVIILENLEPGAGADETPIANTAIIGNDWPHRVQSR